MKILLIYTALTLAPAMVFAEEYDDDSKVDELVQELFLSEIVYPQDANEVQLSTGVQWLDDDDDGDSVTSFSSPVTIEYGITDEFQLGLTIPTQYGGSAGDSGIGNIELESLYNFYSNKESGWAFSGVFGVSFPNLSDEVGEDGFVFEPVLIGYKSFGAFALNLSAGVEVSSESDEETEVGIGVAALYNAGIITPSLEFSAAFEEDEKPSVSISTGATILLGKEVELGLAMAKGLNSESPEWQAFGTLTWEFEL